MGYPEEPQYQLFEYRCPHCRHVYKEAGLVRSHPDYQTCPSCGKKASDSREPTKRKEISMGTILKIECMYCRVSMGEKDGQGVEGTSHGICPKCLSERFPDIPYPGKTEEEEHGNGTL